MPAGGCPKGRRRSQQPAHVEGGSTLNYLARRRTLEGMPPAVQRLRHAGQRSVITNATAVTRDRASGFFVKSPISGEPVIQQMLERIGFLRDVRRTRSCMQDRASSGRERRAFH